jgi:DNA-binding response OmpR family regulator
MTHKIMLIEDDHTMLSLLKTLLTIEGFEVVIARDVVPDCLLADIVAERPDVVLMDVNLRQGNGLDVLSSLRSKPEFEKLHVIMSSGMDFKEECMKKGAQGFLMKPYMPDDLIRMINLASN